MDCTIHVAKSKALISFAVTAELVCPFVFAYADCWFSYVAATAHSDLYLDLESFLYENEGRAIPNSVLLKGFNFL